MNKFYQLTSDKNKRTAKLDIYGTIRSYRMTKKEESYLDGTSGVNSYDLKQEIDELSDIDQIDVYINSYGGEVAEALSIYNTLKRHSAKVVTHVDGIAASAASIIFMAGDVRTVGDVGLLMIHNCMTGCYGANSDQLRKLAEDNDKWNQQSIDIYVAQTGQTEKQVQKWMNAETYFTVKEMLKYGFATEKESAEADTSTTQDAFASVQALVMSGADIRDTLVNAILYGTKSNDVKELDEAFTRSLVNKAFETSFLQKNFAGEEPEQKEPEPPKEPEPKKPSNVLTGLFKALS